KKKEEGKGELQPGREKKKAKSSAETPDDSGEEKDEDEGSGQSEGRGGGRGKSKRGGRPGKGRKQTLSGTRPGSRPKKWALPGEAELQQMDESLDFLFGDEEADGGEKSFGAGESQPYLPEWLKRIRKFFPKDTVSFLQKEAIENKGLKELALEPEVLKEMEPNLDLVNLLVEMQDHIPPESRNIARDMIRRVVEEIEKKIRLEFDKTIMARPKRTEVKMYGPQRNLNWKRTIKANCKNWLEEEQCIVPERVYFYGSTDKILKGWNIIILLDQSGSMGDTIVYSTIIAGILASFKKMKTSLILFDHEIVDVTDILDDPVDILFNIRLGGGTDIINAVKAGEKYIENPKKTIFILISDLYDYSDFCKRLIEIQKNGSKVLVLLAVTDGDNIPSYDEANARKLANNDVSCAIASPKKLVEVLDKIFQDGVKAS
ncbi:VWA domain-containing protein, partial [Candidatus Riflebacteria bacterium]